MSGLLVRSRPLSETISAKLLAARISRVLGRSVNAKQVRARARGDSGTPLLARYGEAKPAYASHAYSLTEADRLGSAFVDAHNKRESKQVAWASLASPKRPKTAPKTVAAPKRAKTPKTPKTAPVAAPDAS